MTVDVEALRKLLERATPGPWAYAKSSVDEGRARYIDNAAGKDVVYADGYGGDCYVDMSVTDAALICAAVNALPELLAVYEAACALRDQPMLVKGNAATWGDVAQAETEGPKLLGRLLAAVDAARKAGT